MPTLPTLAEIEAAAQVVYRAFAPTPPPSPPRCSSATACAANASA